jgi:hypothetical protein
MFSHLATYSTFAGKTAPVTDGSVRRALDIQLTGGRNGFLAERNER